MNTLPSPRNLHNLRRLLLLPALVTLLIVPALAWRVRQTQGKGALPPNAGKFKYTNKLIHETSPYLLEHAHNPVDWYPWGAEALEKAKTEKKPIFLSVGYSACHWCHVMAREDFENEEIAHILNEHFVCIKVDREQRPDIDSQYMLALQMLTESGGWPMSLFLTSDHKPFYGGTYFPPAEFKQLLEKVISVYRDRPDAVRAQAEQVATAIAQTSQSHMGGKLAANTLAQATTEWTRRYDAVQGGFGRRPKFPDAPALAFLLARYRLNKDAELLHMVTNTLDHMAAGGIYDQIGGGFHRYSTDALWRVPHFEKMLYDQAQLVPVYLDAYQITKQPRYRQVAEETLAFVGREMRDRDGGFTSTVDADSEGEEGKYTLWTPEQVRLVLGGDAPLFLERYGITDAGDLEGKSVPHQAISLLDLAKQHSLNPDALAVLLEAARQKLFAAREKRVRPHTDDKVLASWNGLMLAAYARAYQVLGDPKYKTIAVEAAHFLTQTMTRESKLLHNYRAGKADVAGMLEDYADVAYGLLALYEATHEREWLDRAAATAQQMVTLFNDETNGGFYATASQGDLLARLKEGEDNATPAPNGVAALVLARLSILTHKEAAGMQANKTIQAFQPFIARSPVAFPTLLIAYQMLDTASPTRKPGLPR